MGAPKGNQNALKHGFYSILRQAQGAFVSPSHKHPELVEGCDSCKGASFDRLRIEDAIAGLVDKMRRMDNYLQAADLTSSTEGGVQVTTQELLWVFKLYAQACSRLGKLLCDRRSLTPDAADPISDAIEQALDELSGELGVKL